MPSSSVPNLPAASALTGTELFYAVQASADTKVTASQIGTFVGAVTSFTVTTANGLAGSVTTGATPSITLSTTITGLLQGNGTAISAASATGTGAIVLQTSPLLVTPNIGVASGLSLAVGTASASTGSIAFANSASAYLVTLQAGVTTTTGGYNFILPINPGTSGYVLSTDGAGNTSWIAPAGGGTVTTVSIVTANGLAGTVANATTTPAITLSTTITGILQGNGTAISQATATGTGLVVLSNSPTISQLTVTTGFTATGLVTAADLASTTGTGAVVLQNAPSISQLTVTTGFTATGLVTAADLASTTGTGAVVLQNAPSISQLTVTTGFTATGLVTAADLASTTGTGAVILQNAPSISQLTVTTGFTATGLVTNADLANSSMTLAGHSVALGGTQTFAAADLTNGTTGTGSIVLATTPTISQLTVTTGFTATGLVTAADLASTTGTGAVVLQSSPALITPNIGAAVATTINNIAITTATATATTTLTILAGKTLTANNSLTLAGTDGTTMTFPSSSATVAGTTVALGGTGVTANTAYAVLCGGTTGAAAIQSIASVGTTGQILTSNGAGALPTFQAAAAAGLGYSQVASTTITTAAATVSFTGLTSNDLIIFFNQITGDSGTSRPQVAASTDNTNYSAGAIGLQSSGTFGTTAKSGVACITGLKNGICWVGGFGAGLNSAITTGAQSVGNVGGGGSGFYATLPITALQFSLSTGNLNGGTITLYGR